jgi:hypothetical protein
VQENVPIKIEQFLEWSFEVNVLRLIFLLPVANILQRNGINATAKKAKDKNQGKKSAKEKSDLKKVQTKTKPAEENQVEKAVDKDGGTLSGKVVINKATEDNVSISIAPKQEIDEEVKSANGVEISPEIPRLNNLESENDVEISPEIPILNNLEENGKVLAFVWVLNFSFGSLAYIVLEK